MSRKNLLLLTFLLTVISCGGRGGNDSNVDLEYTGAYKGELVLSYNDCPTDAPVKKLVQNLSLKHITDDPLESGRAVLIINGQINDSGDALGFPNYDSTLNKLSIYFPDPNGQEALPNFMVGENCLESVDYNFSDIHSGETYVLRDSLINCFNNTTSYTCKVTYSGKYKLE